MAKYGIFNQPAVTTKGTVKNTANSGPHMTCGDYYGTGFKQPIGKMRSDSVGQSPVSKKGLKTPPDSLA
jgi:hypothetical protein